MASIVPRGRLIPLGGSARRRAKLTGMQLIWQVDPSRGASITVNPEHVSVFFVRSFDESDGAARSGHLVTAIVPGATRDSKYRLTPLMGRAAAQAAHAALVNIMTSDVSGDIAWDDGAKRWTLNGVPWED